MQPPPQSAARRTLTCLVNTRLPPCRFWALSIFLGVRPAPPTSTCELCALSLPFAGEGARPRARSHSPKVTQSGRMGTPSFWLHKAHRKPASRRAPWLGSALRLAATHPFSYSPASTSAALSLRATGAQNPRETCSRSLEQSWQEVSTQQTFAEHGEPGSLRWPHPTQPGPPGPPGASPSLRFQCQSPLCSSG